MNIVVLGGGFLGNCLRKTFGWPVIRSWEILDSKGNFDPNTGVWHNTPSTDLLMNYDVVINTIAITDTRSLENLNNSLHSFKINCQLPKDLSDYCSSTNKKYVHISTACMYQEGDYFCNEETCCNPKTIYTLQKFYADKTLKNVDLILRGRLFFGKTAGIFHSNLLQKIQKYRSFLNIPQSYTSIHTLAQAVKILIDNNEKGIYNVCNDGVASMWEIAQMLNFTDAKEISLEEFQRNNTYVPPHLKIDTSKLKKYYTPPNLKEEILKRI